jgi:hypothetical protein
MMSNLYTGFVPRRNIRAFVFSLCSGLCRLAFQPHFNVKVLVLPFGRLAGTLSLIRELVYVLPRFMFTFIRRRIRYFVARLGLSGHIDISCLGCHPVS